jgi:sugar/nucleoside kinase (ribokinase family)
MGPAVVLLTDGERGMHLLTAGRERLATAGRCLSQRADQWAEHALHLPASATSHLATVGAGDAATAGLLYGILAATGAEEAASIASHAAALKVAGHGRLPRQRTSVGGG